MCRHVRVEVATEADGCRWVRCRDCGARGPKRHSVVLAVAEAEGNLRVR